ncbi:MAG: LysR substrate-binding domain-containing protein [Burkholderiaceae bacterium]
MSNPRIEVRPLRYFVAVVDAGSLSRAAVNLHLAQPALSQQMAQLERMLGVQLLVRSKLGVRPTASGTALYRHAQAVLNLVGQTADIARGAGRDVSGRVRLGLPSSLTIVLAAPLLRAVRAHLPGVRLELYESPSAYLAPQLLDERVDMSILVEDAGAGGLHRVPLVDEILFFAASRKPRQPAFGAPMPLARLAGTPLVMTTRATTLRMLLDRMFEQAGIVPLIHAEVSSIPTMVRLVEDGLIGTIVPGSALASPSTASALIAHPITPRIVRTATLACSQTIPLSAASERVRSLLMQTVVDLVTAGSWPGAGLADAPAPAAR